MAELTCPPFGTGSVDFGALHEAAMKAEKSGKGGDLAGALAKATTSVAPPAAADAPSPISAADA